MANQINTRILLKYDSLENWQASAFNGTDATKYLKQGEIAIVTLAPNAETNPTETANQHPLLIKVGTGAHKFDDLPWASALAADVYAWAKKPTLDVNDLPTLPITVVDTDAATKKFITGISYADNTLTITRSNVDWGDVENAPECALAADLGDVTTLTTTAKTAVGAINEHDAEIGNLASLNTENKGNLVAAINEALQAVEAGGTGSVVTVAKETTPTEGSEVTYTVKQGGKAVDVKIEIPKYDTEADYGVLEVKGDDASGVEVDKTDAQRPIVKIKANTYDAHGAAAAVQQNLTEYENAHKDDYTNNKIDELVGAVEDKVDAIKVPVYSVTKDAAPGAYSAVYHLTRDGEIVGEAINIPKDMVVKSGEVVENPKGQPAGTYIKLVLQNVTDPLYINVGDLIEYVTSGSTADSQVIVDIDKQHKVTATIGAGKIGTTELADKAVTAAKLADDAKKLISDVDNKVNKINASLHRGTADDIEFTFTNAAGIVKTTIVEAGQELNLEASEAPTAEGAPEQIVINHDKHKFDAPTTGDYVSGISVNEYGHVTGYTKAPLPETALKDDNTTYDIFVGGEGARADEAFENPHLVLIDSGDVVVADHQFYGKGVEHKHITIESDAQGNIGFDINEVAASKIYDDQYNKETNNVATLIFNCGSATAVI